MAARLLTSLRTRLLALLILLTGLRARLLSLSLLSLSLLSLGLLSPLLTATALRLALGATLSLPPTILVSLLTLLPLALAVLILTLLFAGFHPSAQGLEIVREFARAVERVFQTLALSSLAASVGSLNVLEHFLEVTFDDAFAFPRLIVPTVGDQPLVLPNAIWNTILPNCTRGFTQLIARLLAILTHAASRLIQIALESGDLIRESLLAFGNLLLLVLARAPALRLAREIVHAV